MIDSTVLFLYWCVWAASQHPSLTAYLWLRVRMLCGRFA